MLNHGLKFTKERDAMVEYPSLKKKGLNALNLSVCVWLGENSYGKGALEYS